MAYNIIPQRGVFSTITNLINENFQRIYQQILGLDGSGEQAAEDISQLESDVSALQTGKANDADVVHKAGTESITGNKTFTGTVVLPLQNSGILVTDENGVVQSIPVDSSQITFSDDGGVCDENVITKGNTVDECLADIDTALGEMLPVDVSSMFASTQIIPTGYTLSKLRDRSLYCKIGSCRYPVTLTPAYIFYVTYNGSTLSAVSKPADAGSYVTVTGTLKDTNGNAWNSKTITFSPVDSAIGGGLVQATTSSSGTYTASLHTGTDYRITTNVGGSAANPSYQNAYFDTGNKTLNIIA